MEAINDFPGAVILISHDRTLLDASAERLWLVADGTVRPYEGDLDEYQKLVVGRTASSQRKEAGASRIDERRQAADRRAETAPLRKKIKEVEGAMAKLERTLATLDASLADETLYVRKPAEAQRLARERGEAAEALAKGGGAVARALRRARRGNGALRPSPADGSMTGGARRSLPTSDFTEISRTDRWLVAQRAAGRPRMRRIEPINGAGVSSVGHKRSAA